MIEQVPYNALDVKGRIKVELFEDDKKVNEVMSNNFISKGVKEHIYKLAMKSLYTRNRVTNGRNYFNNIYDMFQSICLTDASHPSDPENEWLMRGKLIGYALSDTQYAGSESLRGAYNSAESSTTKDSVKMVFDFPTHAANGTIKSVYFRNKDYTFPIASRDQLFKRVLNYNVAAKIYKERVYILGANTMNEEPTSNKLRVYDKQFNLLDDFTLPNYFEDFEIHNDRLYFTGSNLTKPVHISTIDTPSDVVPLEIELPKERYIKGVVYNKSKNIFIFSSSDGWRSYSQVNGFTEYDSNFNLLKHVSTPDIGESNHGKLQFDNDTMFVSTYLSRTYKILYDDYTVSTWSVPEFLCVMDEQMLTYDGYIVPKVQIGSRCLLDTPITKSSKQNMKITYEFVLE